MDNIEKLKGLKGTTINKYGFENVINDVRLDIAIPKGYDQKKLQVVFDAAKEAKVEVKIIEFAN